MNYKIDEDALLRTCTTTNYLIINKTLITLFGIECAVFLSNLIDKYFYFKENNRLKEENGFYCLHENQTKQTGLSIGKIRKCKKYLIEKNIISCRRIGTPAKEYYFLNKKTLLTLMNTSPIDFDRSSPSESDRSSPIDFDRSLYNNNKYNKTNIINYIKIEDFEKFCKIYPRIGQKGVALEAWIKLCTQEKKKKFRPTMRQIVIAIKSQKKSERWQNKKFIPLASTWINKYRWLDDAESLILYNKDELTSNEVKVDNRPEYIRNN